MDGVAHSAFSRWGLPWCVLINLWWVVPVVFSFVDANANEVFAAVTDIQSWKWTHARSSIANVTTLSSHWGWNRPEYFPYAQTLDAFPLTLLRYAFPVLAFLAPFITKGRRRRAATALSWVALVLILVGKGLHVPLAGFNSFLYETIPGMWLLREPATKISPIVVLLYVALTAMTIERLAGMDKTSHGSWCGCARQRRARCFFPVSSMPSHCGLGWSFQTSALFFLQLMSMFQMNGNLLPTKSMPLLSKERFSFFL